MIIKRTFQELANRFSFQLTRSLSSQTDKSNLIKYTQGQSYTNERGKSIREYFYYIDHHGQVNLR